MAGPDGAEQQGFCRGDSGRGLDRTPGGNPSRDGTRRRGGSRHVSGTRGRADSARTGNGRVDPRGASTDADHEGTGMTLTPELTAADAVAGHRWMTDHTW